MATATLKPSTKRRRKSAPAPPSILERIEWEPGYLHKLKLDADCPLFNLSKGDWLWCQRESEPQPGQLVAFSLFDGGTAVGRFHAWQWDEVLITDSLNDLRFVRPLTLAAVAEIEQPQEAA